MEVIEKSMKEKLQEMNQLSYDINNYLEEHDEINLSYYDNKVLCYVHSGAMNRWINRLMNCECSYHELNEWPFDKLEEHMDLYIKLLNDIKKTIAFNLSGDCIKGELRY